jgi:hypothetical protein
VRRLVLYIAALWFFSGPLGLAIGMGLLLIWSLRPPTWAYWLGALLCLTAAPLAIMAEGLPSGPTAGPNFGTSHPVAHVLVASSLAFAGFAAILELSKKPAAGDAAQATQVSEPGDQPSPTDHDAAGPA